MSSISSISFINVLKKSIPLYSTTIAKTRNLHTKAHYYHNFQLPTLSLSSRTVKNRGQHQIYPTSTLHAWRSLASSEPPPEFPQRRIPEIDPTTPLEVPEMPRTPPEIDPTTAPPEVVIPTPPGDIGQPKPPPDPIPNPSGPDFPHPPIPFPPGPDVVPPFPTGPDIDPPQRQPPDVDPPTPPEVFPPPSTPPDIMPPTGPVIVYHLNLLG